MSSRPERRLKRVLVTRPGGQGSGLAEALRAMGMEAVLIPTVEIASPGSYEGLDAAVTGLESFHWVLFSSANAVEAFAERLGSRSVGGARIGAIGAGTARALEAAGFEVSLVPAQAVAEAFTAALLPYARQADGSPTRFLLVRAEQARELLPESLRAAGAEVSVVAAYRTVIPGASLAAVRELFSRAENWPDAITFTSSSSVRNLLALLEEAGIRLPDNILRISIGPITSRTLEEAGFPPQREAAEANVAALAEACWAAVGAPPPPLFA